MVGTFAAIGFGLYLLICLAGGKQTPAPRPREEEARGGGSGLGVFLVVLVVIAVVFFVIAGGALEGGVAIRERGDQHVELGHGTQARDIVSRNDGKPNEYYFSMAREAVLVSKCDATNCANVIVDVRGMSWHSFSPANLEGRMEITSMITSRSGRDRIINRDGYSYVGSW